MEISKIEIKNLFGNRSYTIELMENKLILVAENGGGKTTILKMTYFFLTKKWDSLSKFPFSTMGVTIDKKEYFYDNNKIEIETPLTIIENVSSEYPIKNDLLKIFKNNNFDVLKKQPYVIERIEMDNYWRQGQLLEVIDKIRNISEPRSIYPEFEEFPVMYLPTYRRTENEFLNIFSNLNEFSRGYVKKNFEEISTNLEGEEDDYERKDKEEFIKNFFSNLWSDFNETRSQKNDIHINFAEFGMQDVEKLITNFLSNIVKSKENNKFNLILREFISVVNKYFKDNKKINYNEERNIFFIELLDNTEIQLSELSSGEKQIIAVFTYLYLNNKKYFVIFDEPELSISIFWQKNILPDICKTGTIGMLSATHSPYVYKNMFKNVNSLDNFIKK